MKARHCSSPNELRKCFDCRVVVDQLKQAIAALEPGRLDCDLQVPDILRRREGNEVRARLEHAQDLGPCLGPECHVAAVPLLAHEAARCALERALLGRRGALGTEPL